MIVRVCCVDGYVQLEDYARLVSIGEPDFIEVKAVTYCGKSDGSSLTMENVPWHREVSGGLLVGK